MNVLRNLLDQEFRGKPDHFESEANLEEEGLCGLWGPCLFMPLFFSKNNDAVRIPPLAPSLFGFRLREVSSVKVCRPHFLEG